MNRYATEILNIIDTADCHLTAEEVYYRMKQDGSKAVLATVYNNLNKLVDMKLIHRLVREGEADVYDKIVRHDHLICSRCGAIKDIFLHDYVEQFADESHYPVDSYELKLFYICENCQKELENEEK